jgi:hypothetical protein
MSLQDFFILDRHQAAINWDEWSVELMLRCAIAYGATKGALETWLKAFRAFDVVPSTSSICVVLEQARHLGEFELLRLAQLRSINGDRDSSKELSAEQVELIWRSQVTWALDSERENIRYWTKRMNRYG